MSILNTPENFSEVVFSLLSDEAILAMSQAQVTTTSQFNKNMPEPGGLYDAGMGTIGKYECTSCRKSAGECPGHFGHYKLTYPLIQQATRKKITKNMNLICIICGRYLIDIGLKFTDGSYVYPEFHNGSLSGYDIILDYMAKHKVNKTSKANYCDFCNGVQDAINRNVDLKNFYPEYHQPLYRQLNKSNEELFVLEELSVFSEKSGKGYTINTKLQNATNIFAVQMFPLDIKERFESLKDSELARVGFAATSHPKNFIHRLLLIPPVNLRHINKTKTDSYNNFITSALESIINTDKRLGGKIVSYHDEYGFREQLKIIKDCALKYKNYIASSNSDDNDVSSINTSIKGKNGIIRKDLLGKHIGRVFRCVITCNMENDIDEIGIPLSFAKSSYYKETVTPYNIDILQTYVRNKNNYPGCDKIRYFSTGKNYENNGEYTLRVGDVVYRNIVNGDTIPICRYPSLYTTSTSCVRVKVQNEKRENNSVCMNELVCGIFNADFDGDSMFGFLLADESTRAEFSLLSNIKNNFTNGENGTTWFGLDQDTVIGCGFLTMSATKFTRFEAKLMLNGVPIAEHLTKDSYTGRELFSMVMPRINFEAPSPFCRYPVMELYKKFDENDKIIRIKDGVLVSGIVCGDIIKNKTVGNIYHIIENFYGVDIALRTIRYHQKIISNFLRIFNVTLDYASFCIGDMSMDMIRLLQSDIYYQIDEINKDLINGDISAPSGVKIYDHVEMLVKRVYSSIGEKYLGALLATVDPMKNWLMLMMMMKSKGSLGNITKLLCPIGQINVDGQRLPFLLDYFRTNIWSSQFDLSPESRGYVPRSLMEGTDLRDLFTQTREGRNNIITKGIVTAESGAEGRNCGKVFSSYIVDNKLFITRMSNGEILQFSAGDDNFDYKLLFPCKYGLIDKSDAELTAMFPSENNFVGRVKAERAEFIMNRINCQYNCITAAMNNTVLTPIDIDQTIGLMASNFDGASGENASLAKMTARVNEFCDNLHCVRFSQRLYGKKFPAVLKSGFANTRILIRSKFTNAVFAALNTDRLELLLAKILNKLMISLVHAGNAYGLNVSLTLTSPLTQYLIDAHHASASGGTSRDGINEFKTTINLKEISSMHTVRTYIFIKPEYEESKDDVTRVANFITTQYLKDFLVEISVLYEKIGECTTYPDDKAFVTEALKILGKQSGTMNIVFRLVLRTQDMTNKGISADNIVHRVEELFSNQIKVVYGAAGDKTIAYFYFSSEFTFNIPSHRKTAIKVQMGFNLYANIEAFIEEYLMSTFIISQFVNLTNVKVREMKQAHASNVGGHLMAATKTIYYIEAEGINLQDLYQVNVIDPVRTFCNDINTVFTYCGLMESRNRLVDTINYSFSTLKLMIANYTLIADVMTEKGRPSKINVNGLKEREDDDYLLYASYKHPVDFLTEGAMNGVVNNLDSPDSSIMMGQVPRLGTLFNKIILNPAFSGVEEIIEEDML